MNANNTDEEYLFADEILALINDKTNDLTETDGQNTESIARTETKATLKLIDENEDIFGVKDKPIAGKSSESNGKPSVEELFGPLSDEELDPNQCLTESGKSIAESLKTLDSRSVSLFQSNHKNSKNNIWTQNKSNSKSNPKDDSIRDIFSGIRLINPMISSDRMRQLMSGRQMIKMSLIKSKLNAKTNDIEGDWVTIGVVVNKIAPKVSKNGKQYSIWKLSDLKTRSVVTFFLFGDTYAEHWKLPVSSVIGLLNPKIMSSDSTSDRNSKYTNKSEICSITIDSSAKLLLLGTAKDLGYCKAVKKNQEICGQLINLSEEDYCSYHIRTAYKKFSSKRAEIQTSFSNVGPKKGSDYSNGSLFANAFNDSETKDIPVIETKTFSKTQLKDKRDNEMKTLSKVISNPISKAAKNLAKSMTESKSEDKSEKCSVISAKDVFKSLKRETNSLGYTQFVCPTLAKGYKSGQMIDLSAGSDSKLRAIQTLKAKPIQSSDPNAVKKQQNKRSLDKIKARIDSELNDGSTDPNADEEKKLKKFKNDLIDKALNEKSIHAIEAEFAESNGQRKYFATLEAKEKMENKLSEMYETECLVISCKTCKYTAHSASDLCKKSGHKLVRHKATKRFFKCKTCRNRSFTFNVLMPTKPCSKCGNTSYAKTSIINIKEETTLLDKKLQIRGEEQMFLNSLR